LYVAQKIGNSKSNYDAYKQNTRVNIKFRQIKNSQVTVCMYLFVDNDR